jgi:hypothetical protein
VIRTSGSFEEKWLLGGMEELSFLLELLDV